MAKTNNLTDFLTGLADKFRSKLGGTALINPQSFESKIDEVYQKGYDDAPKGTDVSDTTATPFDVLAGKEFYVASGNKDEGMISAKDSWINPAGSVTDVPNSKLLKANSIPEGGGVMLNTGAVYTLNVPYSAVTNAIGLTGDKIVSGNTVLGVAGTAATGVDVSDTTATASDVVSSKVFYGADGTKQTGEVYVMDRLAGRITNYGGTISGGSVTDSNGTIGFYSDPYGFPLYLKDTGGFSVEAPYSVVAQAIGLTGDKIVSGNTILGVQGTASLGSFNIGSFDLTEGDTAVEIIGMPTTNFSWFEAHIDIISGGSPMSRIVSQYADQCIYKIVICDGFQGSHHVFLYKADGTQIVGNIDDVLRKTSSDMMIDFNQFGGKSIVLPTASFSYAMY